MLCYMFVLRGTLLTQSQSWRQPQAFQGSQTKLERHFQSEQHTLCPCLDRKKKKEIKLSERVDMQISSELAHGSQWHRDSGNGAWRTRENDSQ